MAVAEILFSSVGLAIAKSLFGAWLKDNITSSTLEAGAVELSNQIFRIVQGKADNFFTAKQASIQVDQVATAVAQGLEPIILAETGLDEESQNAVIHSVGVAIWNANAKTLLDGQLTPSKVSRIFASNNPQLVTGFGEAEESLYYRLLDEVAAFLVSIAVKLPGFEVEAFKKVIDSQTHLIELVQEVLSELKRMADASQDSDRQYRNFETRYRQEIAENLNQMDHLGLERLSDAIKKCPLDVAYVSLSAVHDNNKVIANTSEQDLPYADFTFHLRPAPIPIEEILAEAKYLLIKGQAGYGKTTLLRWLAVRMAKGNFEQDILAEWRTSIPFYIRLRDFARKDLPSPEQFLYFGAKNIAGMMPASWVHHHLVESQRGVILVDGVDEMPKEQRSDVKLWIGTLQTTFPNVRILVTSRPSAIDDGWLEAEQFQQATVTPLDNKDIFIDSWHSAVKQKIINETEQSELNDYAAHLKERVKENPMLRDLAGTPLLLSALCAINWERERVLPESRVQLYRELIWMLLGRRDTERKILDKLDSDTKQKLLQKLAYWMISNDRVTATREEITDKLSRSLPAGISIDVFEAYETLIERTGILREPVEEEADFIHLTIQEFLAAEEAVFSMDIIPLIDHADNDRWERVIQFAGGISGKGNDKYQAQLINGLLERRHFNLALESVRGNIAPSSASSIRECARNIIKGLVSNSQIEPLSAAGTLALPFLNYEQELPVWHLILRIRAATRIGSEDAYNVLSGYRVCKNPAVAQALADAAEVFGRARVYNELVAPLQPTHLSLMNLQTTEQLEVLDKLDSLTVYFHRSSKIALSKLASLRNIKVLHIYFFEPLLELEELEALHHVEALHLTFSGYIQNIDALADLQNVTSLSLVLLRESLNFTALAEMSSLRSLDVHSYEEVFDLSSLEKLQQLQTLSLAFSKSQSDLSGIEQLSNLQSLRLNFFRFVPDLTFLLNLKHVQVLHLSFFQNPPDFTLLEQLPNLQSLNLHAIEQSNDISPISKMHQLQHLSLAFARQPEKLEFLLELSQLNTLQLEFLSDSPNLNFLRGATNLRSLHIDVSGQIPDLTFLTDMHQLETFFLITNGQSVDVGFLTNLAHLKELHVV